MLSSFFGVNYVMPKPITWQQSRMIMNQFGIEYSITMEGGWCIFFLGHLYIRSQSVYV